MAVLIVVIAGDLGDISRPLLFLTTCNLDNIAF